MVRESEFFALLLDVPVLVEGVRLFKPETLIGWHRAIMRRKWTFKQGKKPGRPPIDSELEGWIVYSSMFALFEMTN